MSSPKISLQIATLSIVFLFGVSPFAQAAITTKALFHIGETDLDAGSNAATNGSIPGNTLDAAVGTDATVSHTGAATFSNNAAPGSSLSMMISGGGSALNRSYTAPHNLTGGTPSTNWGVEAWMYFPSGQPLSGPSNGSYGGYSVGNFNQQIWQVTADGGPPGWVTDAAPIGAGDFDRWVHTAVVVFGGNTNWYLDGNVIRTIASNASWNGNATYDNLWIGTLNSYGGDSGWRGGIDEMRVFEFAQGAFQVTDLDFFAQAVDAVPEPSTFGLAALGLLGLGLVAWRKLRNR